MPGGSEQAAQVPLDPLVSRRRLVGALRAARAAAGITQKQAAAGLEWSHSKLARIENGRVGVSLTDLEALLRLYGIAGQPAARELAALARAGRTALRTAGYSRYAAVLSPETASYLAFESAAAGLSEFCTAFPPLLWTNEYARAVLRSWDVPGVDEHLALLAERRGRLAAAAGGAIAYLVDEGALFRRVGSPEVMMRQIAGLRGSAEEIGASVAVIPFGAGAYPVMLGEPHPFTVVRLAGGEALAYRGLYDRQEIPGAGDAYGAHFDAITRLSLQPRGAAGLIRRRAAQLAAEAQDAVARGC